MATLGGGGEGSLPTRPPHSSEDFDDAGELPPVLELHTGGSGAVGQASCGNEQSEKNNLLSFKSGELGEYLRFVIYYHFRAKFL